MVINTSLPSANSPLTKTPSAKPATQAASDVSTAPAAMEISSLPELTSPDEAQQSAALALTNILNQSSIALLAQGNHSPETVFSLVQP